MSRSIFNDKSAVPWWAAFGAPLVGVPLLVGLMAFGSAVQGDAAVSRDAEQVFTEERSEALKVGAELPPVTFQAAADFQC